MERGYYASKISQNLSLSKHFTAKILNWLKDQKVITPYGTRPIFYQVDPNSALYIELVLNGEKKNPKEIPENLDNKIRIHNVSFKNQNLQDYFIPFLIQNREYFEGQNQIQIIPRSNNLKNNLYFEIKPSLPMFGGISCITIFTNKIRYFFNRGKEDEVVDPSIEAVEQYLEARCQDCKNARLWLERLGLHIGAEDPQLYEKLVHYEPYNSKNKNLQDLKGKGLTGLKIKLENGVDLWFDDSIEVGNDNPEVNDRDTAILLAREVVDSINNRMKLETQEKEISEIKHQLSGFSPEEFSKRIGEEITNNLVQFKLDFTREITIQMSKAVGDAVSTALKDVLNGKGHPELDNKGGEKFYI